MTCVHTTTIFFRASAIKDSDNGQNPGTSGSKDGASAAGNDLSLGESTDSSMVQPVRSDETAKGSIVPLPGSPRAVVVPDSESPSRHESHRSFATWLPKTVKPLPSPSGTSRVQQVRTNAPAIVPALPIAVVPALPIAGPSNAVEDPRQDRTSAAHAGTSAGSVNRYERVARNSIRPYPTTPLSPPPSSQSNVQPPQPAGTTAQVPQPAAVPQPVAAPQPAAVGRVCSCWSNALQRIRECFVGSCRNCCKTT